MKNKNEHIEDVAKFLLNLKKAVSDTGLSPYAWAKKMEVDNNAVSNLFREGRDPYFSSVLRVLKAMRLSADSLMCGIYAAAEAGQRELDGEAVPKPAQEIARGAPQVVAQETPSPAEPVAAADAVRNDAVGAQQEHPPVAGAKIKNARLYDRIMRLREGDAEFLSDVAALLEARRVKQVNKLITAVKILKEGSVEPHWDDDDEAYWRDEGENY